MITRYFSKTVEFYVWKKKRSNLLTVRLWSVKDGAANAWAHIFRFVLI